MPPHQMPAASPKPERLADDTSVKAILTKVNNKLDPAVPVRTRTPSRVVPCGPRGAQHEPDSRTATSPIAQQQPRLA